MSDKLRHRIELEFEQIDQIFIAYADLLKQSQNQAPNLVEITALASILHSFYNGLENVFSAIAKDIDRGMPAGPQWHRDLLFQMAQPTSNRQTVLKTRTMQELVLYLGFRHFYRHSYAFFLDWNEMEKLVISLPKIWRQTKSELQEFLKGLSLE